MSQTRDTFGHTVFEWGINFGIVKNNEKTSISKIKNKKGGHYEK